nr:glycoside hydrolase family 2 TIM barrel-domain containing protein [Candidatus Njordarchaeota archaeon]
MPFKVRVTSSGPPGAAQVSENSIYRFISLAKQLISATIRDENVGFKESATREVNLCGLWRRLAYRDNLLGEKLADPSFDDSTWPQVKVPDNYGLDGELQRYYGPVWYRRTFRPGRGEHADLIFRGVDYLSDVWLDGEHLGHHEGYFSPFSFDVTKLLKEKNTIAVRVQDPLEKLDPKVLPLFHFKRYIKGTMNYHDSRPGGLPGVTSPAWTSEWGQSLTTGGITQPVILKFTGPVRIDALFVTPIDTKGQIHAALVATNRTQSDIEATFNIMLCPPSSQHSDMARSEVINSCAALVGKLVPGSNRIDFDLSVPDPVLWWPCSHEKLGTHVTYSFRLEAICDDMLSDSRVEQFGIRTVQLNRDPWIFNVNGRPVFIKASNYIPRQHFADVDKSFYDRDMKLLKAANLNSVGLHAHIQCPACYEATDDAGILAFQDFALQWSYDSCEETNPGFRNRACWQIAEMAYLLYNHPSVVYWACHNEPASLFLPKKPPDPVNDRDNQVLDRLLEERLKSVDPNRPIHRASGINGDTHIYEGSIGGGPIYNCRKHKEAGFVSEYGFWSVACTAEQWGDTGWPPDKENLVEWSGRLSFFGSTSTYVGAPNRYADRQSWIRATQLYAAFLAKYYTEAFRVRRGQPFMGIRWHFFVDWWGYAGAGLLDVNRIPKAPYYSLAEAQRPLLLAADLEKTVYPPDTKIEIAIFIVNDNVDGASGSWEFELCKAERSIVIVSDPNAAGLGATGQPSPYYHPIALPEGPAKTMVIAEKGVFEVGAESVKHIKTIQFTTPDEKDTPSSFTLVMKWRSSGIASDKEETNWAHFLVAPKEWKAKPGMQTVP